jgi:hypothetical protein
MDIQRIRQFAGMTPVENITESRETKQLFKQLDEVVQLPGDLSLEDAIQRLDACKRALSIVNKLTDPADKKKWLSATFVNLNKVSAAVKRLTAAADQQPAATEQKPAEPQLDRTPITNPGGATGDGRFMIGNDRI